VCFLFGIALGSKFGRAASGPVQLVCPAVCVCQGIRCPEPPPGIDCSPCNIDGPPRTDPRTIIVEIPAGPVGEPPPRIPANEDCGSVYTNLKECLSCCDQCVTTVGAHQLNCQEGCGYNPTDPMGPLILRDRPGEPKDWLVPTLIWDQTPLSMDPCEALNGTH
jgi:hypothetical protein